MNAHTPGSCPYCDDTGDVHRADGEWLGACDCRSIPTSDASAPAPQGDSTVEREAACASSGSNYPEGFDASCGLPAWAMRAANATAASLTGKREWDVPCIAAAIESTVASPAPIGAVRMLTRERIEQLADRVGITNSKAKVTPDKAVIFARLIEAEAPLQRKAVRLLTPREAEKCLAFGGYSAGAVQREFCRVNGLSLGASPTEQQRNGELRKAVERAIEKLDGYLNSPQQVALGDELRFALYPHLREGGK